MGFSVRAARTSSAVVGRDVLLRTEAGCRWFYLRTLSLICGNASEAAAPSSAAFSLISLMPTVTLYSASGIRVFPLDRRELVRMRALGCSCHHDVLNGVDVHGHFARIAGVRLRQRSESSENHATALHHADLRAGQASGRVCMLGVVLAYARLRAELLREDVADPALAFDVVAAFRADQP